MADEIKPSVSGSVNPTNSSVPPPTASSGGTSPLTPDIKIPSNLPTGNYSRPPSVSLPSQPLNSPAATLPAKQFQASPLKASIGAQSIPTPAPVKPPIAPVTSSPVPSQQSTVFKSSIRTMQEDLASLKKVQTPIGFQIEKQSEKDVKSAPVIINKPTLPSSSASHVELGRLERSSPISGSKSPGSSMFKIPDQMEPVSSQASTSAIPGQSASISSVDKGAGHFGA